MSADNSHVHQWRDTGFANLEDCECGETRPMPTDTSFNVVDHPLEGLVDEAGLERIEALTESAHNTPYDKLHDIIGAVIQKSIERDAILNGRHLRDELLDAIWPEVERREHHYKVTLARLMNKLRAMAEDAEAQILD